MGFIIDADVKRIITLAVTSHNYNTKHYQVCFSLAATAFQMNLALVEDKIQSWIRSYGKGGKNKIHQYKVAASLNLFIW